MGFPNGVVVALLGSPVHPLLSRSTCVIRYSGRRTGRTITTPVQYVRDGDDLLIRVGRPERKTWWRNFAEDHDVDVLLAGSWCAMTGRVTTGDDGAPDGVVVRCRPRWA